MSTRIKKCFNRLFLLGLFYLLLLFNFEFNATYYYQNSPKTDKEGTPFVLLDHLWWYRNGKWSQEGDYIYQVKGIAQITFFNKSLAENYYFHQSNGLYGDFTLTVSGEHIAEKSYEFDDKYQLIAVIDEDFRKLPITDEEETKARRAINATTKVLMQEVDSPLINLQWLYDLTYNWRDMS